MSPLLRPLALICGLALLGPAWAASPVQGTGKATASVTNSCVIVNADSLAFGSYDPTSAAAVNTSGVVQVRCTKATAFSVSPSSRNGKKMTGSAGNLSYELYRDAARSQVFGQAAAAFTFPNSSALAWFSGGISLAQYQANPAAYKNQTIFISPNGNTINGYAVFTNFLGFAPSGAPPAGASAGFASSISVYSYGTGPTSGGGYIQTAVSDQPLSGTATSAFTPVGLTYYGQVPAKQDLAPGSVSDTVTLTVTF